MLCAELKGEQNLPASCIMDTWTLSFSLNASSVSHIQQTKVSFEAAVQDTINFVVSNVSLPVNFNTDQPDRAPSYVNVQAVQHTQLTHVQGSTGAVQVELDISLLKAFVADFEQGCRLEIFNKYFAWAAWHHDLGNWPSNSVEQVYVKPRHA